MAPIREVGLAPPMGTALGLVLIGLAAAAAVYLLPSRQPIPGNTSAAASPPAPAAVAHSDDPVPAPAALITNTVERSAGHKTVKSRTSHRSRFAKRVHAAGRTAVFSEPCRYHCDEGAEPVTWHGGGY
jgi:hypothetical protein